MLLSARSDLAITGDDYHCDEPGGILARSMERKRRVTADEVNSLAASQRVDASAEIDGVLSQVLRVAVLRCVL